VDRIAIVGASLAGIRAAATLRDDGYDGTVTLIGSEPHIPYDRPPLSKQFLSGEWDIDRIGIGHAEIDAELRLGVPASSLDVAGRAVHLADGTEVPYDGVILATGSHPRTLPGQPQVAGVHVLRTIDDAIALRDQVAAGPERVVVIGAGFIGSEVAATCRVMGLEVTVLEALPIPLVRVLGEQMGAFMGDLHRDHGVDLRLGVGVDVIEHDGTKVTGVRLADGSTVTADLVVVGVGVRPTTDWLEGSGLTIDDGVVCDATCTAAPGVVAAGDVCRWEHPRYGSMRVEHWENAQEQAEHAARMLLAAEGEPQPYGPVPWFWSDQYDRKVQVAGHPSPDDEVQVIDGSLEERRFVALYGRDGELTAVLGVNRPRLVVQYRQRILEAMSWADALAAAG